VESRIARQIGVGQPTVREALVMLEQQGLVLRRANQGCVVTTLTRAEIQQTLRVRAELESLAIELAIENAADAEIQGLIDLSRKMQEAATAGDAQKFFELDLQFHEQLWRLSGGTILPRLLSQVLIPLLAFLFIRNIHNRTQINLCDSAEAHVEIANAILVRDKETARRVVREKFQLFAEQHLRWFEQ
jgi:DNA-binding GntR family transcriptional regulator